MADGGVLLSPTFTSAVANPMMTAGGGGGAGGGGFERAKKGMIRKTVDYHCSVLRYLENRVWQRDSRDQPIIQPDLSYFNEVMVPQGMLDSPVNAATTKFLKACTNKARSPIFCTTWVPDGRRLVTGAASGEFTLWNGINFNFESIIQAHDCSVRSMNWSHSGKWMVTTDDRGYVKYWQINFNNVHTFQAHSEPVRGSSFSPTDAKLATCSDDGTVRIFDFLSCTEEHLLRGHGADVKCLHWHPTKSLLVSGSKDNQQPVKLWDPKAGQSVCTIHAHKATVMDVKWNPNGNWFGTASRDHLIKIYDIRMMKELWVLKGHKKDVNTLSWHPVHEKLFTSGGSDGAILFWTMGIGREIGGLESAHEGFVWSLSWHPLGHLLCSGANDHTCKFWCRNRPGEEIRDKYSTFHNPFLGGDEDYIKSAPGMVGQGGVSLPPPPSRLNNAVNLPPPSMATATSWKPPVEGLSFRETLGSPQVNVPVLGADIIAQTFSANKKPADPPTNGGNTDTPPGHQRNNFVDDKVADNRRDFDSRRDFDNRMPLPPHASHGGSHMNPPLGSGPGYKGPPPPPQEDSPGFNRYIWRKPDQVPVRHPSIEEDHRWSGNRFNYRRGDAPSDNFNSNRPQMLDDRRKEEWIHPRRHSSDVDHFEHGDDQFIERKALQKPNLNGPELEHKRFQDSRNEFENKGNEMLNAPPQPQPSKPPPHSRGPPLLPDPRESPVTHDYPLHDPRSVTGGQPPFHGHGPHNIGGGLSPSQNPRGPPPHDSRGIDHAPHRGPTQPLHDPREGGVIHEGDHPHDLQSPLDPRGGPPLHNQHGPPPHRDDRGIINDSRGPRGSFEHGPQSLNRGAPQHDRGLPPPNDHGLPSPHDHGPPPPHDRGPPPPHHRGPPPHDRGPPPHDRGPPPHDRGPPPHDRGPPPHDRGPPPHDRGPPPHDRGPPPHDRGPPPHDRGPPPHDRGPLPHDRGPPPHDRGPLPPFDHGPPPPPHNRGPFSHDRGPLPSHGPPPHDHGPPPHDRGPPQPLERQNVMSDPREPEFRPFPPHSHPLPSPSSSSDPIDSSYSNKGLPVTDSRGYDSGPPNQPITTDRKDWHNQRMISSRPNPPGGVPNEQHGKQRYTNHEHPPHQHQPHPPGPTGGSQPYSGPPPVNDPRFERRGQSGDRNWAGKRKADDTRRNGSRGRGGGGSPSMRGGSQQPPPATTVDNTSQAKRPRH